MQPGILGQLRPTMAGVEKAKQQANELFQKGGWLSVNMICHATDEPPQAPPCSYLKLPPAFYQAPLAQDNMRSP